MKCAISLCRSKAINKVVFTMNDVVTGTDYFCYYHTHKSYFPRFKVVRL